VSKIIEACTELGQPIIEAKGYTLVDLEFVKEGKNYVLRYMIDSENGVDIDDCAEISEKISQQLDVKDPISQEYMLEITSPGAERPLKTKEAVKNAIGQYVNVRLYAPIEGIKAIEGDLVSFIEEVITIEYKVKTAVKRIEIPYDQISKIRLAIRF
jgi:ribosome maturation factor RimP